ncbi:uncharacterized protein LOC120342786 [Styela clava]
MEKNLKLFSVSLLMSLTFFHPTVQAQENCADCQYYVLAIDTSGSFQRGFSTPEIAETKRAQFTSLGFLTPNGIDACNTYRDIACGENSVCTADPDSDYYLCNCIAGDLNETRTETKYTCTDIDECKLETDNCDSTSVCENTPGSFQCNCLTTGYAWNGLTCEDFDECTTEGICTMENSFCENTDGSYICSCKEGYQLDSDMSVPRCLDIDECSIGSDGCDKRVISGFIVGFCSNNPGSYICVCNDGFASNGDTCEDIDECEDPNVCAVNEVCTNTFMSYTCTCKAGYELDGTNCADVDECTMGTHDCAMDNAGCINIEGGFECSCLDGYTGDGKTSCTDIDECAAAGICANGECNNLDGTYECTCSTGFSSEGKLCVDIDECTLGHGNCHLNAECENTEGSFTCACKDGFQGDGISCEAAITTTTEPASTTTSIAPASTTTTSSNEQTKPPYLLLKMYRSNMAFPSLQIIRYNDRKRKSARKRMYGRLSFKPRCRF